MQDIRKINDKLYVGRSSDGIPVECRIELRKDIDAEVWCVYVDLRDDNEGGMFIQYTETLEQALLVAGSLADSDLPVGTRYTPVSELLVNKIYDDLAADLAAMSNNHLKSAPNGYQLGYLAALNDLRHRMIETGKLIIEEES